MNDQPNAEEEEDHQSLKSVGPLVLKSMSGMRKSKIATGGHLGYRVGPKIDREPPLP